MSLGHFQLLCEAWILAVLCRLSGMFFYPITGIMQGLRKKNSPFA